MGKVKMRRWKALGGVGLALLLGAGTALPVGAGGAPGAGSPPPVVEAGSIPDAPAPEPTAALQPLLSEARTSLALMQGMQAVQHAEAAARAAEAAGDVVAQAEAALIRSRAMGLLARREDALKSLQEAEQLWARVGDGPGQLSALGPQLLLTPDPQRVRELAERAAGIGERETRRRGAAAKELTSLGAALFVRQHNEPAVRIFAVAVKLRRASAPGSLELAETLAVAGQVLVYLHQRALADEYLREARDAFENRAPNGTHFSGVLMWLGILALDRFDLAEARAFLSRALPLSQKNRPGHWENGRILTFLGVLSQREGKPQDALGYHQRASEIYKTIPPAQGDYAVSLLNEGLAARDLLQDDLATTKLHESRELLERQQPGGAALALLEEGLGLMLLRKKQYVESERHMRAALAIRERLYPDGIPHAYSLGNLGAALLPQKRLAEAEAVLARGWKLYLRAADELSDPQSVVGFGQETHWLAQGYCDVLRLRGRSLEALLVAEQARGRGLQQILAQQGPMPSARRGPATPEVAAARLARAKAEAQLAQRALELARAELVARRSSPGGAGTASPEVEAARKAYIQARDAQALARAADARAEQLAGAPRTAPEVIADSRALAAALRRLPAGTVYVCFKEQGGATLLITADLLPVQGATPAKVRVECFPIPLSRGALAPRLKQFALAVTASSGEGVRYGRELFRDLFPGAARGRVLAARRLLISPEGDLWALPFAALVTSPATAPPRYLGLSHPLAFTPSLANAAPARKAPATRPDVRRVVLAAGDPVFGQGPVPVAANAARLRSFLLLDGAPPPPLPGTRADAVAVAKLYGGTALLGEGATEEAVRARLPQADVIHLATHGYLSPRWALGSGVLLSDPPAVPGAASAPDSRNDGALQAWELMTQVKLKASLVVLAACETGLGETLPGEGLIGLTRALQVAGARSVVTSQWRVQDDATRTLMVRFHQGVRSGLAKDEALRQAMAAVQKQGKWSHPYYWAGFLLTGSPEPL